MMKQIVLFLLLAVCSLSVSAQPPSKKCPVCGLSIPKCQYKGKHPETKPAKPSASPQRAKTKPSKGTKNGHEWVDLGLTVKWATMNIGAASSCDCGDYFSWGATMAKSSYSSDNCKTFWESIPDISGNSKYDAAIAQWGKGWRLPKKVEFEELINKCAWEWEKQNKGYRVTSKINGNSIFLPAAYGRPDAISHLGEWGLYWCSTPYVINYEHAYSLFFDSDRLYVNYNYRYHEFTIRPVTD